MVSKNHIVIDDKPFSPREETLWDVEITSKANLKKKKKVPFKFSDDDFKEWEKATYDEPYIIGDAGQLIALYKARNGELKFNYFVSYYGLAKVK